MSGVVTAVSLEIEAENDSQKGGWLLSSVIENVLKGNVRSSIVSICLLATSRELAWRVAMAFLVISLNWDGCEEDILRLLRSENLRSEMEEMVGRLIGHKYGWMGCDWRCLELMLP